MSIDTGVIADDLTGGVLVASYLEKQGISCPVFLRPAAMPETIHARVVVLAERLRLADPTLAASKFEAMAGTLRKLEPRQLYYKYCATFDSTDEGNIGTCADVLLRMTGVDRIGFCTAFPARGITVYQGHIFLHAQLLSNSPKRFDPLTPMPDPDLVAVLGRQTDQRVGLVPHHVLRRGVSAAVAHVEALVADGTSYLIFDAVDDDDISTCARLTTDWPAMTGGDSLSHLAPALRIGDRRPSRPLPRIGGPAVVIAGSCGHATLDQLRCFEEQRPVLRIDLVTAGRDPARAVADALNWADAQRRSGPIAIAVSQDTQGVARTQRELGRESAARLGESICAELAAGLCQTGFRRFVVAGGETSGAVAFRLGIDALDVAACGPLGGGLCYSATPRPLGLFFKAGKLGPPDLFLRAFDRMEQGHDGG